MDITITDVTARAGVAFPAPAQRPAPANPARTPVPRVAAVTAAREVAEAAVEHTPPLPVAAERAAIDRTPPPRQQEPGQAQRAYAMTITDALWELTKSFRTVV